MTDQKSDAQGFREELTAMYDSRKIKGLVVVVDGEKVHFAHMGMGAGAAIDALSATKQALTQKILLESAPQKQ